ncbi:uridine kinase family protein [Schumannella luteola]
MDAHTLVRELSRRPAPLLVGIEGFGGSGKSTLARSLSAALAGSLTIPMDDFIVRDRVLDSRWDEGAYDHERLERDVLIPARSGSAFTYQPFDWEKNRLGKPLSFPATRIVIIEGITAYHPRIRSYYDVLIWVDTPLDVARERGRARDAGNDNAQHWDQWAATDLEHFDRNRPRERADYIISGL